jgi:hypothetical protein
MFDTDDMRAFQSCFDARDKLALEKADPAKPVCPDHHTEMITSYQLDLKKVIWARVRRATAEIDM